MKIGKRVVEYMGKRYYVEVTRLYANPKTQDYLFVELEAPYATYGSVPANDCRRLG